MIFTNIEKFKCIMFAFAIVFGSGLLILCLWDISNLAHAPNLIETFCVHVSDRHVDVVCSGSFADFSVTLVQNFVLAKHIIDNRTLSLCAWERECQRPLQTACFLSTHVLNASTCWVDIDTQYAYLSPFYITHKNWENIILSSLLGILVLSFTIYTLTLLRNFIFSVRLRQQQYQLVEEEKTHMNLNEAPPMC